MKKTNDINAGQDTICIENQVYQHISTITNTMLQKMAVRCISNIYEGFPIEPIKIHAHDLTLETYPLIDDPFIGPGGLMISIIDSDNHTLIHETRISGTYYNKLSHQMQEFDLAKFFDLYTCFPIPLRASDSQLLPEEKKAKWPIVNFNNDIHRIMNIGQFSSGRYSCGGVLLTLISCETGNMTMVGAFDDGLDYYVKGDQS